MSMTWMKDMETEQKWIVLGYFLWRWPQRAFKRTYYYCFLNFLENYLFPITEHNHRLQFKDKHLVVRPTQEDIPDSDIKRLVLNTPHSQLFYTIPTGQNTVVVKIIGVTD